MSELWEDRSTEDLFVQYYAVRWCLKEKCHAVIRTYDNKHCLGVQICTEEHFDDFFQKNYKEALEAIKLILDKRGATKIPRIQFTIMTEEETMLRDMGFIGYKQAVRMGLKYSGRGVQ